MNSTSGNSEETEILFAVIDKIVPCVAYTDWNDFVQRVYTTQHTFNVLISEGVLLEKNLQREKPHAYSSVKTGNPPLPIFDGQCLQSISSKASSVLKMLTRGEEGVFTSLVGKLLYNQCLQVVSAYTDTVYFHACYNSDDRRRHDEHHLEFEYEHLCDLLRSSVQYAFSGLMPVSMCFSNCGFIAALMSKNFCVVDCDMKTVMSCSQYQAFLLALFMGLHARLGTASALSRLDADVLRHISASLLMPRDLALSEFVQREMWLF
jgi:hypothetical protein